MKTFKILFYRSTNHEANRPAHRWLAALLVTLLSISGTTAISRAQQPADEEPGAQVLTRGPVHEAFAGIVSYDPEPGVVIAKSPPAAIEEIPPEERPEGDNVSWIPGYWAWDDERSDFLWISGTWRALPPGREWMAGYWGQTPQGYQWISGYWADSAATETTYLPAPPQTVEAGPNLVAPSDDYGWTPGCWLWYQGRYAWRPGYWTQGRADWDWIPAHYVWTPRGYIFVEGFWDYPVERRGILFAPVYFESGVYSRRGYHYSPSIVISLSVFSDHLFLRPRYQHYYFGDYYASNYQEDGFYASFSFQSSRHGYDPFYSRQRWAHRDDRAWEHQVAASYQYRRDHETARPPRTWSAQIKIDTRSAEATQNRVQVAVPIDQLAKSRNGPVRFQPVARGERKQLVQRGQEVQKSREQRRTLEAKPESASAHAAGAAVEPAKVPQARSPIVAKPANKLDRNEAPPKIQQPPKPDQRVQSQPKAEPPGRQPKADQSTPPTRQPETETTSNLGPAKTAPRERQAQPEPSAPAPARRDQEKSRQDPKVIEPKAPPESDRRTKAEAVKPPEDSQRQARDLDTKSRNESAQRTKDAELKARENSRQNTQALEQKARQESAQQAKAEAKKNVDEKQRNTREAEMKAQQETEQRAKVSTIRAQEESQRNAQEAAQKTQRESIKPDKKAADTNHKETVRPAKKDEKKEEKKKPQSSEDGTTP